MSRALHPHARLVRGIEIASQLQNRRSLAGEPFPLEQAAYSRLLGSSVIIENDCSSSTSKAATLSSRQTRHGYNVNS